VFKFKFEDYPNLPENFALIVSRISEEKGIAESFQLFSQIAEYNKNMKLVVAGDAMYDYQIKYKNDCIELSKELGIEEKIVWLGHVSNPHTLFAKAALYFHLPNFEDPFPTTVMEALALGCRIVTNGRGGISEQVLGFDGVFVVDSNNNHENINSVITFLENTANRYDRLSQYKQKFDEDRFHSTFENIVTNLHLNSV
jgi:glycosyltransferase involved in cell wall biosynthesis